MQPTQTTPTAACHSPGSWDAVRVDRLLAGGGLHQASFTPPLIPSRAITPAATPMGATSAVSGAPRRHTLGAVSRQSPAVYYVYTDAVTGQLLAAPASLSSAQAATADAVAVVGGGDMAHMPRSLLDIQAHTGQQPQYKPGQALSEPMLMVDDGGMLLLQDDDEDTGDDGSQLSRLTNRTHSLYKTELCRSWEETGCCRYGGKCQFAHGREELRPVQRHPKYKTEVCRTFATTGTCPYGTRCRFIHNAGPMLPHQTLETNSDILPVQKTSQTASPILLCPSPDFTERETKLRRSMTLPLENSNKEKRLPIFKELSCKDVLEIESSSPDAIVNEDHQLFSGAWPRQQRLILSQHSEQVGMMNIEKALRQLGSRQPVFRNVIHEKTPYGDDQHVPRTNSLHAHAENDQSYVFDNQKGLPKKHVGFKQVDRKEGSKNPDAAMILVQ